VNDYEFDEAARALFRQTGGTRYGYLFLDGPFADLQTVHDVTGKPVMVTEYTYRTPTPDAPVLYPPFLPTVATQAERADRYERYMRELLARPFMVGAHWFQYYDQPATGRSDGENSLFGMVTIADDPYPELTARMQALNGALYDRPGPAPAGARRPRVVAASGALGERLFSVDGPLSGRTGFFVFILPGANLATDASGDPLVLEAGTPDEHGVAPLRLQQDAVIGIRIAVGDVACLRMAAAGSSGAIACDGGMGHDVTVVRAAGEDAPAAVTEAYLGTDSGPGAATLLAPTEVALLPAGATLADCRTTDRYAPPEPTAFTTATVTTTKGGASMSLAGEPFVCGPDGQEWRAEDGAGMLVVGLPLFDSRVPGGDLAAVIRLADRGSVCP
jgi:hypothetical protein